MTKIIWSKRASDDFKNILKNIIDYDINAAEKFIKTFRKSLTNLISFPKMGRIVPERDDPEIREILIKKYRIIYTLVDLNIFIITIFHGSKRFKI